MPRTRGSRMEKTEDSQRQVPISVSCAGSHLGSSKCSNATAIRAKAELRLAKLEQRLAEVDRACQLRILEAERKVEIARASVELSDELLDGVDAVSETPVSDHRERIEAYVKDCEQRLSCNVTQNDPVQVTATTQCAPQTFCPSYSNIDLPRVDLCTFDGDPSTYWKFMRQFEEYIEKRVLDPGQRFLYLQYYCRGSARQVIEGASLLPSEQAYKKARETLREFFGQPHKLARSLLDKLLAQPKIRPTDTEALLNLAINMQSCEVALSQLQLNSDLNAMHTLESIVRRLPAHLQREWAKKVDVLLVGGREPVFGDLQGFIATNARIAQSRFGLLANETSSAHQGFRQPRIQSRKQVPDTQIDTSRSFCLNRQNSNSVIAISCPCCGAPHPVDECAEFKEANITQRWQLARDKRCCFICLQLNHQAKDCRNKVRCKSPGCRRWHHIMLHQPLSIPENANIQSATTCATTWSIDSSVLLGIVPVRVRTTKGVVLTYALLDDGSDATLITRDLIDQLEMPSTPHPLKVITATGATDRPSCMVSFEVGALAGFDWVQVDRAFAVNALPIKPPEAGIVEKACRMPHLDGVNVPHIECGKVQLLIGADVPEVHWAIEQRLGRGKQPYATRTILGWVLRGPLGENRPKSTFVNCIHQEDPLLTKIKQVFDAGFTDADGVEEKRSVEDARAMNVVSEGSVHQDAHFTVPLPWRLPHIALPNNRILAEKRLYTLKRRFEKDQSFFRKYSDAISSLLSKKYAEKVPQISLSEDFPLKWYLPHHAVLNPHKPDKFRVVLDCAASVNGQSLNGNLLQGPDMLCDLIVILLRFRRDLVAIAADIEEMFMQVQVPSHDRAALRFLWWKDSDVNNSLVEYQMRVHPFGATSSPFCATYALQQTIKEFAHEHYPSLKDMALSAFYVDDCLTSFPDCATARRFIKEICCLMSKSSFRLRKWISSHPQTLDIIPPSERANLKVVSPGQPPASDRMLGLEWEASTDCFRFNISSDCGIETRRKLLSTIASIYDPLGFLAPVILPAKVILQDACRLGLGWDEPLPSDQFKSLQRWKENLKEQGTFKIRRCLRKSDDKLKCNPELHIFSDASEKAYGAVCYVLYRSQNEAYWSLTYAKSRVAPIKAISIPRLELAAAVLATRIQIAVTKALGFGGVNSIYWTDSMTVLHYIKNTSKRFSTFVANRVAVINRLTLPSQWRHIRSEFNPADVISRGIVNLHDWSGWVQGPSLTEDLDSKELPSEGLLYELELKRTVCNLQSSTSGGLFLLLRRFSNWMRLARSVAWLVRFKQWLIARWKRSLLPSNRQQTLRVDEVESAEHDIFRLIQQEVFHNFTVKDHHLKCSPIRKLCPVIINGLLCVGGRLSYSEFSEHRKHPIILPDKHPTVEALVWHHHLQSGHAGPSHVLTSIRESVWIVHGLKFIQRVLRKCVLCRKISASPVQQIMAPLPATRTQVGWFPFKYVGVDYFGPLIVKRGRGTVKRFGCLFTCLQIRAVHLEVVSDLSTDAFIMAFLRFIARRGRPSDIYSDNGTNFVGTIRELRDGISTWDLKKINDTALSRKIQWHFNPPYASHRGGVWERLIRSVRRVLITVNKGQITSEETMNTLLVEAEGIINRRPLFQPSTDCRDIAPLTPNSLLMVGGDMLEVDMTGLADRYTKRWKQVNHLANVFWKRWLKEYLPTLQSRQRWHRVSKNLKPGELVLLPSTNVPRHQWPLGLVEEAEVDTDGAVRTVRVKTSSKSIVKDVRQICRLEGVIDDTREDTWGLRPSSDHSRIGVG